MTITLHIKPSGAPDHKLQISQSGVVRGEAVMGTPIEHSLWKGAPLLLTEVGDEAKWAVVATEKRGIKSFAFKQRQVVKIPSGTETFGTVIARSDYANGTPDQFLVRHLNAIGDQVEVWYEEDLLTAL